MTTSNEAFLDNKAVSNVAQTSPLAGRDAPAGISQRHDGDAAMAALSRLCRLDEATPTPPPGVATEPPAQLSSLTVTEAAAAFVAHRARADEASRRFDEAQAEADRLYPPMPDLIRRKDRPDLWEPRCELERMDQAAQRWSSAPAATPRVDAYDAYHAARATIDQELGIPALDAAWNQAKFSEYDAADSVAEARPTTIEEAAIKYAVLLASYSDGGEVIESHRFFAFLEDLERIAG